MFFVNYMFGSFITLVMKIIHIFFFFQVQMKVAWNLKVGGISGFTMAHDELPVLHDVFSSAIASGCHCKWLPEDYLHSAVSVEGPDVWV